jgi:Bifunctional DNA primase/polymerase, N-terminal
MNRKPTIDVAKRYLDRFPDHKLFPVAPGKKTPPCLTGYATKASSNPKVLRAWHNVFRGCSWGLAPAKSDIVVLDVDRKPGKNGQLSLDMLKFTHGPLPETSTALTTTGGLHIRYRATNAVRHMLKQNAFGEHIDSPAYTIIAGCELTNGLRYEWANDLPLAPAPGWLAEYMQPTERGERAAGAVIGELDTADAINRAVEMLQGYARSPIIRNARGKQTNGPAVQGENGDEWSYQVALNIGDLGISEFVCLDLMFEHFNSSCDPPWQYDDAAPADRLSTKVRSAYTSRETPLGSRTAAADFPPLDAEELASIEALQAAYEKKAAAKKRHIEAGCPTRGWQS